MASAAVELRSVNKAYVAPTGVAAPALTDVTLSIRSGEFVVLLGRSGSGKSTLLNLIAGLDQADSGALAVGDQTLTVASEDALATWRGRQVGVVFQFFQLLPTLTVLENILLAMEFVGAIPRRERRARGQELLQLVGVADQANKLPAALSGGQQQRAAIARALANDPAIIVADEPTGNLDSATAATVLALFRDLVARGRTVVLATHDETIAAEVHRVIRLADGRVIENQLRTRVGAVR